MDSAYHIPALAPPAGVIPHFTHPDSQASIVSVSCILCLVLITVLSVLRFYTNLWIQKSLKADDSMFSHVKRQLIADKGSRLCLRCSWSSPLAFQSRQLAH